jgi:N-formylglutamate amidohydrolase
MAAPHIDPGARDRIMAPMDVPAAPQDLEFGRPAGAAPAAFDVVRSDALQSPVIFASPHSGRLYPAHLLAASALGPAAIRRSEDCLVDTLLGGAPAFGFSLITARYARAYIDLNREAYELDPAMFEDELPTFAQGKTARVAAGLGAIAKIVGEGQEIYARKLSFAEAQARIDGVYRPYHAALSALMSDARATFGAAILIDWHSMPSAAARPARGRRIPDFVLGDRFGASCAASLSGLLARELKEMGYEVARNSPYAGGYTTEFYGRPGLGAHVLQIEINRALYLDETALAPNAGFAKLKDDVEALCARMAAMWRALI